MSATRPQDAPLKFDMAETGLAALADAVEAIYTEIIRRDGVEGGNDPCMPYREFEAFQRYMAPLLEVREVRADAIKADEIALSMMLSGIVAGVRWGAITAAAFMTGWREARDGR